MHVDVLLFYSMCAYWICPCSYGIYHCVAAVHPMVEEIVFPAELHADRFDDPELRQLAKAFPAVLVRDCTATTVATYPCSYKSWMSWASRHDAAFLPADSVAVRRLSHSTDPVSVFSEFCSVRCELGA